MTETAEAFASRASAILRERDRDGYKALFDLPCMVWADAGTDIRADEARLDEVFDGVAAIGDRLGMIDYHARITAVLGLGDSLTVARVLTSLSLADGTATDPMNELWVLRERGGRLRFQALLNTITSDLLRPTGRPLTPFDEPPAGTWPATGAEFVGRMNRICAERDVDANVALMALPYFRIGDDGTGLIRTSRARRKAIETYHAALARLGGYERIELLAERPMGAAYLVLRVRAQGATQAEGPYDSGQELWILHERNGALRLVGTVNPASVGFVSTMDFVDAGARQ